MLLGEFKEYRGYKGTIEHRLEDDMYHGKLLGVGDLVTYESKDVINLYAGYCDVIDEYVKTNVDE